MRTTLDLDEVLMKRLKQHAVEEGKTLTRVLEDAARAYLAPKSTAGRPFRLKLLSKQGRLLGGTDLADRDSLYERMDGRR